MTAVIRLRPQMFEPERLDPQVAPKRQEQEAPAEARWPLLGAIAFAVGASLVLWGVIVWAVSLVF